MQAVTLSPKYQIVIPLAVRRTMRLVPGQKLQVIVRDEKIELLPDRDITELRGLLKERDISFKREEERL